MFRKAAIFCPLVIVFMVAGPVTAEDWSPLWSTATLSQARASLAATSVGDKVLFGGGGAALSSVVDIYDASTSTWSTATLSEARYILAATAVGTKAFFAGGNGFHGNTSRVDVYDTANNTWSTAALSQARDGLAATSVGDMAFFGGGYTAAGHSNVVDIYDSRTGAWSAANLSTERGGLAATSAAGKVFFGGGWSTSKVVDIYDTGTETWSTATLSQARFHLAGASAGGKVLFGGGSAAQMGSPSSVVDICDVAADIWSTASLSQARAQLAAAAVGDKVLFAGGGWYLEGKWSFSSVVDIYDTATGAWSAAGLSQARSQLAAASVGHKVLFAGGVARVGGTSDVVDIYTLQNYDTITTCKTWTLVDQTSVAGLMQLNTGGSLNLGSFNLTVGSMAGAAPIDLSNRTLTVGSDNTSSTYSGSIVGSGTLVKTGDAALTLTGSNSYSGPTSVNAGFLLVNGLGSLSSPVTVNVGGTLGGNGRVGQVTVKADGHIAPGASASALRLNGDLTLEADAKLDFELGPPAFSDLIAMDSGTTLFLNGQQFADFTFMTFAGFGPGNYTLIDAFAIDGSLGANCDGTIAGLPASLAVSGNDLVLTVVPEPSAVVLLVIGVVGVLAYARRWRWRLV